MKRWPTILVLMIPLAGVCQTLTPKPSANLTAFTQTLAKEQVLRKQLMSTPPGQQRDQLRATLRSFSDIEFREEVAIVAENHWGAAQYDRYNKRWYKVGK